MASSVSPVRCPSSLSLEELLVELLGEGARDLAKMNANLRDLARGTGAPAVSGVSPGVLMRARLAFELGRRRYLERAGRSRAIRCATDAAALLDPRLRDAPVEVFMVLLLDGRHRVAAVHEVSRGTLTTSLVHPREVFRPALLAGSASVLVAHNHPSGDCEPSPEDDAVTDRLVAAGELLGIPVLDHLVLGDGFVSYRERGHSAFRDKRGRGGQAREWPMTAERMKWHRIETPSGAVGLVTRGDAVAAVWLPGGTEAALLRRRDEAGLPAEPEPLPASLAGIEQVFRGYFSGGSVDPASVAVPLDLGGASSFVRRVYSELRRIPRGSTVSYGELASRAGSPRAARAVGSAMARNPLPILIPCHRVLNRGGGIGAFSGPAGSGQKEALLRMEGAIR